MGKSSKQTVGFHYLPAFHVGLSIGPIDAYLEFRGGDKTAWAGELTASGTIQINAPNLWGGEKDQGGIVGNVDVMFGEPDQQVNPYLSAVFGSQQSAWRGLATLVFKGGKYGAMNPYPQKASHKICKIQKGWGAAACWYPETAEISLLDGAVTLLGAGWEYQIENFSEPNTVWNNFEVPTSGWQMGGELPFSTSGRDPYWRPTRSNIWLRRRMRVNSPWVTMKIGADNGCVVWMDGVNAGSSNPTNEPIANNEDNPVTVTLGVTGEVEVIVKAFAEINRAHEGGNIVNLAFTGMRDRAMNPAHILYYSRTQEDMGRESVDSINEASFVAAANWFYSHGFGLCTSYDPSAESVDEFEQRICRVAGCSLSRSPLDGQWYLDIANGEYDLATLPVLNDDDILDFEEQPTLQDSAVNSVSIKYFDPIKKEAIVTPPTTAPALIAEFGSNHLTIEYPEIPAAGLALRVAQRELLARITPARVFRPKTTRKPYAWRPNTYFRLQTFKRRIADMVCILGEKSSGQLRSGAMSITAAEDIYSLPLTTYVSVEEGVDTRPSQVPKPIVLQQACEVPYIEVVTQLPRAEMEALPVDVGFLMAVAADPATTRDYTLVVDDGAGYDVIGDGAWGATAVVNEAADHDAQSFTLSSGRRLIEVAPGMPALWGSEIVRVDTLDVITGEVTFGRACADTVPVEHPAGERVWFFAVGAAFDTTEYRDGEALSVKLLTNTASARLDVSEATIMTVEISGRHARPYPPAAVRINGVRYPQTVSGDAVVTGTHRDRLAQADQLVDQTMADIGPEPGTTYVVRNVNAATGTETYFQDGITAFPHVVPAPNLAITNRLEVYSVRAGLESLQRVVITFSVGAVLFAEDGEPITDEVDDPIIME